MKLWVGTAGYAYPAWVGAFYPPKTPADRMLAYYARHFAAVEVNSSFYRPPTVDQVARMARAVPAGFGFTLKVPKSASHGFDAAELPAFRAAAGRLAADGKLLGLVAQVPESFHNVPANRAWLARVRGDLTPFPVAVEFRHRSWDEPALADWAGRHGLDVASVGVPDIPSLFPAGLRVTGPRVYARLHSLNAANWYAGGPTRYDYDYPDDVLAEWADGLRRAAAAGVETATVFFNNCVGTQAVDNAKKLVARLAAADPAIEVVRPTPAAARGLFDEVG